MKIVLFAHDGYISVKDDVKYSTTYDTKIVERYLKIAENIVFMVRNSEYESNEKKFNKISTKNFSVIGIENFKTLHGIFNYRRVTNIVEREVQKADYIVARIPSDLGFLAAKYAKKYNKMYMVEVVGCPWDSLRNHSALGKTIAPLYYLKQKMTLKKAPYASYVTNEFLQKRYPCRGLTIGCSDVEIHETNEKVLLRRTEKIKNSNIKQLTFGTMGALNMKYKGYDTVIKALVRLSKEGYTHKYLIAGSGDSTWLEGIITKYNAQDIVTIIPAMPHEKVFEYLDNIDIYIQPSLTEGLPRSLIEALSRGCPSLGSNTGGIPELLNKEFIFKKGSVNEICRLLKKIDKSVIVLESKRSFNKAKEFNKELLDKKRIDFYNRFKKQKGINNE